MLFDRSDTRFRKRPLISSRVGLHLKIERRLVCLEQCEQFSETRNSLVRKSPRPKSFLPRKPTPDLNLADLIPCQLSNSLRQTTRPAQRAVVNYNWNTIARESNIKLDPVSPNRERLTKRRHRILRRNSRCTTMPNDQH